MNTEESMPLWLDIKIEYIDANLDRVIAYLKEGSAQDMSKDAFYNKTIQLLENRIDVLMDELEQRPLYGEGLPEEQITLETRLLGLFLCVHGQSDAKMIKGYVLFLSRLQKLAPSSVQSLTEKALDILLGKETIQVNSLPFGWEDIQHFNPQVLAQKVISGDSKPVCGKKPESWLQRNGSLHLIKNQIEAAQIGKKELAFLDKAYSLGIFDDRIRFVTKKGDKLKQSEEDDIEKIDAFTRNFILGLKDTTPEKKMLKTWNEGDHLKVYVYKMTNGIPELRSFNPEYECIEGRLCQEKSYLGYDTVDFYNHLQVNDVLEVTLAGYGTEKFSVMPLFNKYTIEGIEQGEVLAATIFKISPDKLGHLKAFLWTEMGYIAQGFCEEDRYQEGDTIEIRIIGHGTGDYYTAINSELLDRIDAEKIEFGSAKEDCIKEFLYDPYEEKDPQMADESGNLDGAVVKELCRMMLDCQKFFPSTTDRYRTLSAAQILSCMMGWKEDAEYISFIADYLENLVAFVRGKIDKIKDLSPAEEFQGITSVQKRMDVISILKLYDNKEDEPLGEFMDAEDELLSNLAALVHASNSIGSFISPSMKNVIKREIIRTLSINDEGESDLENENGIYLGQENDRQEFKTSFFYAPKNAKEQDQKITIFKGVCAFLNSRNGGTLYLGVDDLGYVRNIDDEIARAEQVMTGAYFGIDGYVRYITDQAKKYFDLSILTHVRIVPMYDNKVVALEVRPYEYGIVELEGNAYMRLNNETVKMSEATKRKLMSERILGNDDDAMIRTVLQDAIDNKRKVILHGYSSSSGKDIRDRQVEPYAFAAGGHAVFCYDLEDDQCKVFKLDRISNAELLKERWTHEAAHRKLKMDIFRMTGEHPCHVYLQLNMLARNLLLEEYEEAEKDLIKTKDSDVWYLNTDVYSMEGVGRFYIGLANCIKILNAPELEEYVKEFKGKYL